MANNGISVELPQSELDKLDRLIKEMEFATGAESKKVIRNVARDFCRIALRKTPLAKKNAIKWGTFIGKDGKRYFYPNGKVKSRGLAKSGWSGCLTRLGVARRGSPSGGGQWGEVNGSKVETEQRSKEYEITTTNKIPFIEDFDNGNYKGGKPKHILEKSLRELNLTMERRLSKMAQKILRRG